MTPLPSRASLPASPGKTRIRSGYESVTDSRFGDQVLRPARFLFEFAAQLGQIHAKIVGFPAIGRTPHFAQQVGLAHQAARGVE